MVANIVAVFPLNLKTKTNFPTDNILFFSCFPNPIFYQFSPQPLPIFSSSWVLGFLSSFPCFVPIPTALSCYLQKSHKFSIHFCSKTYNFHTRRKSPNFDTNPQLRPIVEAPLLRPRGSVILADARIQFSTNHELRTTNFEKERSFTGMFAT